MNIDINTFMQQFIMQSNPAMMNKLQNMFYNKSREQQIKELKELYKSKGMDLDNIAKQYGIQL